MKALGNFSKELEHRHGDTYWFKALKLCYKGVLFMLFILLKIVEFVLGLFPDNEDSSASANNFVGMSKKEGRTPDDIWKLTSGNDYYKNNPPDSFS